MQPRGRALVAPVREGSGRSRSRSNSVDSGRYRVRSRERRMSDHHGTSRVRKFYPHVASPVPPAAVDGEPTAAHDDVRRELPVPPSLPPAPPSPEDDGDFDGKELEPEPLDESELPPPNSKAALDAAAMSAQLFRQEFGLIQRDFRKSLNRQGKLLNVIRDLKLELADKTMKLQWAYQLKVEDGQTIESLRKEVNAANAQRDAALDKEQNAKELAVKLQEELLRLKSQIADLQTTVAHLSEEPRVTVQRRPILEAGEVALMTFDQFKIDPGKKTRRSPGKSRKGPRVPTAFASHMEDSTASSGTVPPPSQLPETTPMERAERGLSRTTSTPSRLPTLARARTPLQTPGKSRDPFDRVAPASAASSTRSGGNLWETS